MFIRDVRPRLFVHEGDIYPWCAATFVMHDDLVYNYPRCPVLSGDPGVWSVRYTGARSAYLE